MAGVIQFVKGSKKSSTDVPEEKEKIGSLTYEVFKRGVVHISDSKGHLFKKNCGIFEEEMDKLDLDSLTEGKEIVMRGSGDNDHLVFCRRNGDIDITLRKREFGTIQRVKDILHKVSKPKNGK